MPARSPSDAARVEPGGPAPWGLSLALGLAGSVAALAILCVWAWGDALEVELGAGFPGLLAALGLALVLVAWAWRARAWCRSGSRA